jgi:hypothetical protein
MLGTRSSKPQGWLEADFRREPVVRFYAESTRQEDLATLLEYGKQWVNAK